MKKKSIIIASILVLVLALGSYFYFFTDKFSADTIIPDGQIDAATLASIASSQAPNMPVIQLDYSKAQIETAIINYRNTTIANLDKLSDIDKQINAAIEQKRKKMLSQQALPTSQSADISFIILDKDGNQVNQAAGLSAGGISAQSVPSVADNFDFATNIPQITRDNLVAVYPKIQDLYGPRSNTNKIKVEDVGANGCFDGRSCASGNSIMLATDALTDIRTTTHELIHTFHGVFMLRSLWEEGMTESATEIVLKDYSPGWISGGLSSYEISNLPYLDFQGTLSPTGPYGQDPYIWGSAAMYKIYLENNDFYKNLNAKIYLQTASIWQDATLIKYVSEIIPTIEGEKTLVWFSHQYPFISPGYDLESSNLDTGYLATTNYNSYAQKLEFSLLKPSKYQSISLKAYYSDGTEAGECSGNFSDPNFAIAQIGAGSITPVKSYLINESYCKNIKFVPAYNGYLKNIITTNGDESNKRVFYTPVLSDHNNKSIIGIINGRADQANVSNIDTGWNANFSISNGIFTVADESAIPAGRYKVDISVTGKIVKTRYFNKSASSNAWDAYTVFIDLDPPVNSSLTATPMSRSISLKASSNSYAGYTFRLNGIPLFRTWSNSPQYIYSNLNKNTNYSWAVLVNSNSNMGKGYWQVIKTLSQQDFKITKMEKIGNIGDSTFKLRYTFNIPYDAANFNKIKLVLNGRQDWTKFFPISINQTSTTTLEIVPKVKLYNNTSYYVSGLENITDKLKNPLYQYNYSFGEFSTHLNPIGAVQPSYTLVATSAPAGGQLQINTNFSSPGWQAHLDNKFDSFRAYLDYLIATYRNNIIPESEVSRLANIVQGCISAPTDICRSNDMNGDGIINSGDIDVVKNYQTSGTKITNIQFLYDKPYIYGPVQAFSASNIAPQGGITPVDVDINMQVRNNNLVATLPSNLESGKTYNIHIPQVIDTNNNYVPSYSLSFVVQ